MPSDGNVCLLNNRHRIVVLCNTNASKMEGTASAWAAVWAAAADEDSLDW